MATYIDIATTVKDFLVTEITELSADTAKVADIDGVMDALYNDKDTQAGLLIDFLYAVPHQSDSGRAFRDRWDTYLGGMLILQFTGRGDTETDKNSLIEMMYRAFDGGTTKVLSGTDKVSIIRIDRPDKSAVGEHPFYFMPFTLMVNHGGKE